jgi:hypothetical protein
MTTNPIFASVNVTVSHPYIAQGSLPALAEADDF